MRYWINSLLCVLVLCTPVWAAEKTIRAKLVGGGELHQGKVEYMFDGEDKKIYLIYFCNEQDSIYCTDAKIDPKDLIDKRNFGKWFTIQTVSIEDPMPDRPVFTGHTIIKAVSIKMDKQKARSSKR